MKLNRLMLAVLACSVAAGSVATPVDDERAIFRAAWDAAGRGQWQPVEQAIASLGDDYPLTPYLRAELWRARPLEPQPAAVAGFLAAHGDWSFAAGLRRAWLRALGRADRFAVLLRHGRDSTDTRVRCHLARARLATGKTRALAEPVRELWLSGRSQPEACDPAFEWLHRRGGITPELAWRRVGLAMAAGETRLAGYLERYLDPDDRRWLRRWRSLHARPGRAMVAALAWPDVPRAREIVAQGFERLARRRPRTALDLWPRLSRHFGWDANRADQLLRTAVLFLAVDLERDALGYIDNLPAAARDTQMLEWRTRVALAHRQWPAVLESIRALPAAVRSSPRWRYWRARALESTGRGEEAAAIYTELGATATYHGFLAAERAHLPYAICSVEAHPSPPDLDAVARRPRIRRALELWRVGLTDHAWRTWHAEMSTLSEARRVAAAVIARRQQWTAQAVATLARSRERNYYTWRFPLLHQEAVRARSAEYGLDPAWLFGIMRAESALRADAVSPAGALGLMQLMPGTARNVARQHGIRLSSRRELFSPAINIRLGSAYLAQMRQRFAGNPVLASGAYNAGPEAVDRWLRERPVGAADIWIETLPYYETRAYLPRVLAFTQIYDWRLTGAVKPLSVRMQALNRDGGSQTIAHYAVGCPKAKPT